MSAARSLTTNTHPVVEAGGDAQAGPWPRGVSREAVLSIGYVADELKKEFPTLTVSKIRFLENEGLVIPARTGSGYRKYSQADIERLRFILTRQRDSYLPLRVIGDELSALDAGHDIEVAPVARVVASEGKVVTPQNRAYISARDLSDLTGVDRETLEEYSRLGLITPDMAGYFPTRTVHVVALVRRLEAEGVDTRVLRSVRHSAERSADIVDQLVDSQRARGRSGDKEKAAARATDLGELFADLHREMLRTALSGLNYS